MPATSSNKKETSADVQRSASDTTISVSLERHGAQDNTLVQFHDYAAVKADIQMTEEESRSRGRKRKIYRD